jgi:hypothetical protein
MRYDSPFVVKRLAPMMGRPNSPRRIVVAQQAYTLDEALQEAKNERQPRPPFWPGYPCWIERRGQPATRKRGPK